MKKSNRLIYWISTLLLSLGMLSGGIAQVLKVQENVDGIANLGYPVYFLTILGTWKALGVIALLIPKFPLLKEWAYAGFFFAMSGAVLSHIFSGDPYSEIIAPFVFIILTVTSWLFRPAQRKAIK